MKRSQAHIIIVIINLLIRQMETENNNWFDEFKQSENRNHRVSWLEGED